MTETEAFLAACDEQKRLLGKMRMLWAFHRLYAVDDVETHPGAKEWRLVTIAAAENKLKMGSLAKCAINSIRQANYDPAMLFELVESASSWERFNQALEKNIPALRVAAVGSPGSGSPQPYPAPALLERDQFVWENILKMSFKELKLEQKNRKNFGQPKPITSEVGFRKAALRYSQHHKLPTRNFREETPYSPTETN